MKKYTDLMIDLETLSTRPDAVILQIGWCFFDRHNPNRKMFSRGWYPDVDEQVEMGRHISIDTINWWMVERSAYNKQKNAERLPIDRICAEAMEIWESAANSDTLVWAKGTSFDVGIWRTFLPEPWSFRNVHDLRTLKLVGEMLRAEISVYNGLPHDAVFDAETQAREVQVLCSTIEGVNLSTDIQKNRPRI